MQGTHSVICPFGRPLNRIHHHRIQAGMGYPACGPSPCTGSPSHPCGAETRDIPGQPVKAGHRPGSQQLENYVPGWDIPWPLLPSSSGDKRHDHNTHIHQWRCVASICGQGCQTMHTDVQGNPQPCSYWQLLLLLQHPQGPFMSSGAARQSCKHIFTRCPRIDMNRHTPKLLKELVGFLCKNPLAFRFNPASEGIG